MEDDTHTGLTRRRLLTSLATIGGSLSAAGTGTWALFSDREQGNLTVQAGTVSLSVAGGPDPVVTIDDVTAGTSGTERLELTNTGTMDAGIVVCLGDIDYRRADDAAATEEADSGQDEDDETNGTGSGKVSDIEFNGCGTAKVHFEDDFDGIADVTVEYGTGEKSERTVDDEETPLTLKKKNGGDGYIASVTVDGTTYRNDACKHVGETENGKGSGNGANGSANNSDSDDDDDDDEDEDSPLADALTVEIGLDHGNGSRETLFAESELEDLLDGGSCAVADGDLVGGDRAELYVNWQADDDAEGLANQAVDLDIEVNLQA